jgi:hypothetical protein
MRIIRSSVRITFPVVFSSVISSGVRIVSMIIGGGGDEEESVRTPLYCSRSEAVLPRQCRPGGSGRRMNLSTIADPYDLAGGDVAGDVENHGRWWW